MPLTIEAVGCRVVHGGAALVNPALITPSVLDEMRALKDLAPLHVPTDIAVIESVQRLLPGIPVIAVFDTAFHHTIPEVARTYALPADLCVRHGLRRKRQQRGHRGLGQRHRGPTWGRAGERA